MLKTPLVTIGIPTYNRAAWLKESLTSCLTQSYGDIEIVVCDNASSDATCFVVKCLGDPRIKYFRHDRTVPAIDNWNSCWKFANGEYMTYLSDDDLLEPDYVSSLVELAEANPEVTLYRCRISAVDLSGKVLSFFSEFPSSESGEEFFIERIRTGRPQFLSGFLFRKADIQAVGGFHDIGFPAALYADDYLWFRMAFRGAGVISTNQVLWSCRDHPDQISRQKLDLYAVFRNVRRYVDLLVHLARENCCSSETLDYLKHEYGHRVISMWINLEIRRQRARSIINYLRRLPEFISVASQSNVTLSRKRLLKGVLGAIYL